MAYTDTFVWNIYTKMLHKTLLAAIYLYLNLQHFKLFYIEILEDINNSNGKAFKNGNDKYYIL